MSKIVLSMRIDSELLHNIDDISLKKKRSRSNMINYILSNYVEQVSD